jgi:SAM-dependent methyltransferase
MVRVTDETSSKPANYLLDNRESEAGQRFDSLAALFNPVTFRHVEKLGIADGWRCWEVGAGGPSVAEWLGSRVGSSGHVLATDIDTSWTADAAGGNVEVRQHDVAADDPPDATFDLVHARLVLVHVPERERALRQMVLAVRPGGWLLIEDFDVAMQPLACVDVVGSEERLANKIRKGFLALLAQRGVDLEFGRRLPRLLREAGLIDVEADSFMPLALAAGGGLEKANVRQVRGALIAGGQATADEIEAYLLAVESGRLDVTTPPLISVWGRKP